MGVVVSIPLVDLKPLITAIHETLKFEPNPLKSRACSNFNNHDGIRIAVYVFIVTKTVLLSTIIEQKIYQINKLV